MITRFTCDDEYSIYEDDKGVWVHISDISSIIQKLFFLNPDDPNIEEQSVKQHNEALKELNGLWYEK
jgi:hypothetical protein